MTFKRVLSALVAVLLGALFIVSTNSTVRAQTNQARQVEIPEDETNLDTQLYLIVGTNQAVPDDKLPSNLDGVVRQLRSTLPFKNYRLAATLINRVKNEGRLDLSWIGGPLASSASPTSPATPSFSQFKVRGVKLVKNTAGEPIVQMSGFSFGARVPIQVHNLASTNPAPVTNYENTGLATDISIREGEPVIVGTLNVGPSGDAIILVVSAKRTNR